jgi:SAM-dependent methyltransferase
MPGNLLRQKHWCLGEPYAADLREGEAADMTSPAQEKENDWIAVMRKEWEVRAKENARYFICTDIPADDEAFFSSGRDDYNRFVRPFLARQGFDPGEKVALEVGCGIGRMTRWFAQEFREVTGLDISAEMVKTARRLGVPKTQFVQGTGSDLAGIDSASVDFVFSYIVFQHIPDREIILNYVCEAGRVLRPGGLFRLHLNGLPHVSVGGCVLEGYISHSPRLQSLPIKKLPFVRRRRLGSWLGHPISAGEVRRVCRRSGLALTEVHGRWTTNMWIGGMKNPQGEPFIR